MNQQKSLVELFGNSSEVYSWWIKRGGGRRGWCWDNIRVEMEHGFMTEVAFHTRPKAWLQHFSWNMKRLKDVMLGNKKANLWLRNYDRLDKMCWCQNVHHPLRMGVCSHWDISTLSAYVCCIPSRGLFSLSVDTHRQPHVHNIKTASDLRNTPEVIRVGSDVTTPTPVHCFSPFSVPWCVYLTPTAQVHFTCGCTCNTRRRLASVSDGLALPEPQRLLGNSSRSAGVREAHHPNLMSKTTSCIQLDPSEDTCVRF